MKQFENQLGDMLNIMHYNTRAGTAVRYDNLTPNFEQTLFTLWSIVRIQLMSTCKN